MPPRIIEESNRPRVSDRTMVANLATTTLVRFKKTKGGVTITSMKPLGMGTRCLAAGARRTYDDQHHGDRCTQGWGLDARKYPRPSCGRGKMSLDIPFYRTRVTACSIACPPKGGLLSRGSSPASYPTKPLGSYHVSPTTTWMDPPSTGDLRRWGAPLTIGALCR